MTRTATRKASRGSGERDSARTAAAFLAVAQAAGLAEFAKNAKHFCLSAQVAAPLCAASAHAVSIAASPTENALIDLIERP